MQVAGKTGQICKVEGYEGFPSKPQGDSVLHKRKSGGIKCKVEGYEGAGLPCKLQGKLVKYVKLRVMRDFPANLREIRFCTTENRVG